MELEDLEERINKNTEKLELLTQEIEKNLSRINENSEKIGHNTGALALLHTINSNSNKYFIIWIITFIFFCISLGYNIYTLNQYEKIETIETQEVEQSNDSGDNNYIGRDGDINGKAES